MEVIVNATFIGTNSLGFENGKKYKLYLNHLIYINKGIVQISTIGLPNRLNCEYSTWDLFIRNWDLHDYVIDGKANQETTNLIKKYLREKKLNKLGIS